MSRDEGPQQDGQGVLTARELQVARLIVGGLSNRAIGRQLDIATSTVARHVANIMSKLEVNARAQIAAWMLAHPGEAAEPQPGPGQ